MEFRQLEYFQTLSKVENFTRTAEALHVSQPSVTKAIQALEAELELTLIDRSQKHITLTDQGHAFLLHVEKILRAIEETQQDMLRFHKDKQGVVNFCVPPMMEAYLFPKLFTGFKEAHPNTEVHVMEYGDSSEIQARIEESGQDFGMIIGDARRDQNSLLIMKDQMSLCVSPQHPMANRSSVSFNQLQNEKFILQQPNTHQYKRIYARCIESGFTPDIVLNTSQLKTIKQLVANNVGISFLMDLVTRNENIFRRVPVTPAIPVSISLIWSKSKCLSPAAKDFLAFMRSYVKSDAFKAFSHDEPVAAHPE